MNGYEIKLHSTDNFRGKSYRSFDPFRFICFGGGTHRPGTTTSPYLFTHQNLCNERATHTVAYNVTNILSHFNRSSRKFDSFIADGCVTKSWVDMLSVM
jgi:hypothetical protein